MEDETTQPSNEKSTLEAERISCDEATYDKRLGGRVHRYLFEVIADMRERKKKVHGPKKYFCEDPTCPESEELGLEGWEAVADMRQYKEAIHRFFCEIATCPKSKSVGLTRL